VTLRSASVGMSVGAQKTSGAATSTKADPKLEQIAQLRSKSPGPRGFEGAGPLPP